MNRREYLAMVAVAGGTAVAGCVDGSSGPLSASAVDRADPGETHLTFSFDDDRVATVSVQTRERQGNAVPVMVAIAHPGDVTVESLELALQAPPGANWYPMDVAFVAKPWRTAFSFYRRERGARLEIPDVGLQGESTVVLEFIVWLDDDASELLVDGTVDVAETGLFGPDHTLTVNTTVPLAAANRANVQ